MSHTPVPKDTESYPQGHNHFNLYNQNSGQIGEKQNLDNKKVESRGSTGNQHKNFEIRSMARSSDVNQSKRQAFEEPQENLREEVQRSPLKKTENSRPQTQKCPSWLKTLILLISLVALGGFAYWFFFKRGKPDPFKRHKGKKDKQSKSEIKSVGNQNDSKVNLQKVQITKTSTIVPVLQKSQQKSKDVKKQQKVEQKVQDKKVSIQTKKDVSENKQSSQKVLPIVPIQKTENKQTAINKSQTLEAVSKVNQKQKVETAKVEEALVEKVQAPKQVKPETVTIKPVQQTKKEVNIIQTTSTKSKTPEQQSTKENNIKIQQKKTIQENTIKETPTLNPTNVQQPKDKITAVSKDNSTDEDSTIVVKKGNRVFCPGDQFLLNGNCMKCPQNMVWSGLNCVLKSNAVKHLKRAH